MLPTPADYANTGTRVTATCRACLHFVGLDLPALVAAGWGDVPLVELPLRCSECGRRGHLIDVAAERWKGV